MYSYFNEITLENSMILLEAYRGKDSTLKKAEAILDEICEEIRALSLDSLGGKVVSYANDRRIDEVEKLLKARFKASEFNLFIYDDFLTNSIYGTNGFTIPQTFASFMIDEDGMSTGLNINVNVGQALIHRCDLTGGELLGIIIHEVGHNVRRDWLRKTVNVLQGILDPLGSILLQYGFQQYVNMKLPRNLDKSSPEFMRYVGRGVRIIKNLFNGISKYGDMLRSITFLLAHPTALLSFLNPITYVNGYVEEKYADSLATSLGYGPDLARALHKFENLSHVFKIKDTPTPVSIVEDFILRSMSILVAPVDVHPDVAIRITSQIKYMKRELNNPDIPAFKKKELAKELADLERYMEEVYLNSKAEQNKKAPFTYIWNVLVYKMNGIADLREIFNVLALEA